MKKLPLPPFGLRESYPGCADIVKFLLLGKKYADIVPAIARDQDMEIGTGTKFLEFGSGCGMISRHIVNQNIICTDHNISAIDWCQSKLSSNIFYKFDITSKLQWPNESFDIIFAPYIFTWFNEADQNTWLLELSRVIKQKGMLLIFLRSFSESMRNLRDDERKRYESGELVVVNPSLSGQRQCRACHPQAYVEKHFSQHMPVVNIIPQSICTENEISVNIPPIVIMRKIG